MGEELVGKVTRFFPKISVAVIKLEQSLKVGDKVKFVKNEESFEQTVSSMQIEHQSLEEAQAGQEIGFKTEQPVKEGTLVYKIE